ncbi:MAG: TonB-dependent receptor [Pseudomonadota bacterium]
MKYANTRRRALRAPLQATPVAAAAALMAAALSAVPGTAGAQTSAAPAGGDVVTVTGIRRGIESAINVKKNSDNIVEAISAEDIGKLPDSSIAESIARLPGLAAQRVGGRATEINIRGLSGDFANTLLNGREQVSTGNNRSVEFDQYPSELTNALSVFKTPDASLVGQGLSGTLNIETIRPLSLRERVISVNARGERNGGGTPFKGDGSRFSLTYVDQFADRTVGVALGVAQLKTNTEKSRKETYGETDSTSFAGVNGGANFTFNQGFKYFVDKNEETRTGAMAAIEVRPSKNLSTSLDIFYSEFEKAFTKRGIELQVNDSWKAGDPNRGYQAPTLNNAVIQGGRLISGVWGNVNPLSRTIWEPRDDKLESIGWNTKWKFAPTWTGVIDLSRSSAKSTERIVEMEAGVFDTANNRPLPGTVTVGNYNEVTAFQYNHGDPAIVRLTDPESWGQNGYDKVITTNDKIKAIRLQVEKDLDGIFSRVTGGVNFSQRDKTKGAAENFLRLAARDASGFPNIGVALPAGTTTLAIPGSPSGTVNFDPGAEFPSAYRLDANVNGDILNKGWTVNEDVRTIFVKGDIDTKLFGLPVRGNLGVQLVNTDQSSTAPVVDNTNQNTFTLRTAGKSYNDVLPTLNLAFGLSGDQTVRLGLGRQMARPRMDQLRAFSRSEVGTDFKWTGSGGNPKLDPFRATALDLSYEKYFGTKGYVSVAGFYKDLKSYIFEVTGPFDFTGFPNLSGRTPVSNIGKFTLPLNGTGGSIQGVEVAVNVPLNLLTPMLNGFGVIASHSSTDSKIKPFGDSDVRPLPGLSRTVTQLTAYYEMGGFSARVASRKRGAFIAEIEGFGADREFKYARGETIIDYQIGYEFRSGPLKGLGLLLQVNNANNEPYREYDSGTGRDTKLDENGRTILFGATFKF